MSSLARLVVLRLKKEMDYLKEGIRKRQVKWSFFNKGEVVSDTVVPKRTSCFKNHGIHDPVRRFSHYYAHTHSLNLPIPFPMSASSPTFHWLSPPPDDISVQQILCQYQRDPELLKLALSAKAEQDKVRAFDTC